VLEIPTSVRHMARNAAEVQSGDRLCAEVPLPAPAIADYRLVAAMLYSI